MSSLSTPLWWFWSCCSAVCKGFRVFVRDGGPFQRALEIADRVGVDGVSDCVGNDTEVILLNPRLVKLRNSIPSFRTLGK